MRMESPLNQRLRRSPPDVVYTPIDVTSFERWDKSRGIHVTLPFETHVRPTMMHLAHWIYSDETLQSGVTEGSLVQEAADYLCPRVFEDRDEAESGAHEFIEFCQGRAWVFTDTGTTPDGESLYQFTHRTFLEFFTAGHLARTHRTPQELASFLRAKIVKREWDVVAQLAVQIKNKEMEGAGDEILTELIGAAAGNQSKLGWNLLSFTARCLEFVVPSPLVRREIASSCLEQCLEQGTSEISESRGAKKRRKRVDRIGPEDLSAENLLQALVSCATENRPVVADTIEKSLLHRIKQRRVAGPAVALEIGANLTMLVPFRGPGSPVDPDAYGCYEGISQRLSKECATRIRELSPRSLRTCYDGVMAGVLSLSDVAEGHGIEGLFRQSSFTIFPRTWTLPIVTVILMQTVLSTQSASGTDEDNYWFARQLHELGELLQSVPSPWVSSDFSGLGNTLEYVVDVSEASAKRTTRDPLSFDTTGRFGALAALAVMHELTERVERLSKLIMIPS